MSFANNLTYTRAVAITLNDTAEVACKAIMVSATGTLNVTTVGGDAVTLTLTAGVIYPIECRLLRTGGTATGVFALN